MNKTLTIDTAEPRDIWPDGSGYSAADEREIMDLAKRIPAEDIARSGLVFASWYVPYYLAQDRWQRRQAQQAEQQQKSAADENRNASEIAKLRKKVDSMSAVIDALTGRDGPGEMRIIKLIQDVASELFNERKVLRDAGIWTSEKLYGPGAAATHAGGLWIAQQESRGVMPGDGVCWRLSQKTEVAELRALVRDAVATEVRKQMPKGYGQ
jgi:predicted ribonuclease toxin of YeeF-YezG toxin-antitoxin module